MISRGFNKYALGPILTLYAQKRLKDLEIIGKGKKKSDPNHKNEKKVLLETIVSLLPREKNTVSVSFLSMLLRSTIHLETTMACRLDLEKRIGIQLGEAILDDILIPSFRFDGDTLFNVDTVQRILVNYHDLEGNCDDTEKVRKLMESYLAEIASDCNLSVSKFISLVECMPKQERATEDGMYRAVDIYLKAHPALGDTERKKLCILLDCQNLTPEACSHAAKNGRLSSETVTQVLYYEQQRLKERIELPDDLASLLEKENQDLKFELVNVKIRLKEMERSHPDKSPWNRKSFMNTISKKFVKFTPFFRAGDWVSPSVSRSTNKLSNERRHSIS